MHDRATCGNRIMLDSVCKWEISYKLTQQEVCLAMFANNLPAKPVHLSRLCIRDTFRCNNRLQNGKITVI
jgi:hypothetical protein